MQTIKIQCPAKINLNLKILGKLSNGYHEIESVMQTINLFDYLTITVEDFEETEIRLSGNSNEIPYDERNLAYKAAKLYLEENGITNKRINIYIEKNIPVAAGLAGGSTDGAGVLYGLDKIFCHSEASAKESSDKTTTGKYFANAHHNNTSLDKLCSRLGSDLNVCLHGGKILAKGRGEITTKLDFKSFNVSLIKPLNLGISAKDAYSKYAEKIQKMYCTDSPIQWANDLEWAITDDYEELQYIKRKYPKAVMTGSGSTYFLIGEDFEPENGYWVENNLKAIDYGVSEV